MNENELLQDEIASILGAVLKSLGGKVVLREEDFNFQGVEQEIMLIPGEDEDTLTVALGSHAEG